MHEMKVEAILGILAQETWKSELWRKRHGKRRSEEKIGIFGKF
jgi:hypothetical protein